jgi:two-component system sensor histidine kinase KdpD
LINNFKLATELGGEVIQIQSENVAKVIVEIAEKTKHNHYLYRKTAFEFV